MARNSEVLVQPTVFWRRLGETHDRPLPAPFHVRLDPGVRHVWAGTVAECGHGLDGRRVYLSQRNSAWTGEVHVDLLSESNRAALSGYARINPRPAKPALIGPAAMPNGNETAHDHLLGYWAAVDYPRLVTHGEAEVASLETHYGVQLPADFRAYLLHACPTLDDGGGLDEWNAWWGLERIRSLTEECSGETGTIALWADPKRTLGFVDHMMWCWAWAICCDGGPNHGRIMLVSAPDRWVANSFSEFVERYLVDQKSLY